MMKKVYVVDGARTPFLKSKGKLGPFSGGDLAVGCARPLLARQNFAPTAFDEVIVGAAMPSADEANIGRVVALRVGCGDKVPAWTVMRNCASGMQALDSAYVNIQAGKSHLVLAGGTDAMSHAPLLFGPAMVNWLADWYAAKSFGQRAGVATQFRLSYLAPVIAILKGLTDPIVKLSMGQTAEIVAGALRREVTIESWLACGMETSNLLARLAPHAACDSVLLVGHEPDFSTTIGELLGTPEPAAVLVKKASLTAIDAPWLEPGAGQLQFSIPCRLM